MGVANGVWREIQAGRAPDAAVLSAIVDVDSDVYSTQEAAELGRILGDNLLGVGPLENLVNTPGVTDVLVNGTDGVWCDQGRGLERADIQLPNSESVRRLAVRLASAAGRRLDDASPYVDAVLPGGVRLHAILPPLVEGGAHLSLRVPGAHRPSLDELVAWGFLEHDVANLLVDLIRRRVAFVISGGTGSGKTTLLGALLANVAHTERILVVEDVRELVINHPHVVRLEARPANVEGAGEVSLTTLVRQSLRMRPDRVVVGEVRGPEVRDLMAALNTGHEGGCGTLHANSPADVPARFEALGALAGMPPEAVRTQLASAIRVIVHLDRHQGRRIVSSIGVIRGDHRALEVRTVWTHDASGSGASVPGDVRSWLA